MQSSISSENGIFFSAPDGEFEQGGGEQQEKEQISNLKKEVRELKNMVSAKDSELQDAKRQIAQSNRLAQLEMVDGRKYTPDIEPFILVDNHIKNGNLEKEMAEMKDQLSARNLELQKVNAKNEKLKKEMGEMKDQLGIKNSELQELKAKNGNLEKEMGEMKDQLGTRNLELQEMNAKEGNLEKELRVVKDQLGIKNEKLKTEMQKVNEKNEKLEKELRMVKDQLSTKNSELQELNAKNGKLEKKVGTLKDQLGAKNSELQQMNAKNEKLEKEMGETKEQLNGIENRQIYQIVIGYIRTLPAANSDSDIICTNGHHYLPEMGTFLHHGAAHCRAFGIWCATGDGFVGYPANFFDNLIRYYYETKVPAKAVRRVDIGLSLTNPAPWPAELLQPRAGKMNVEEVEVDNAEKWVKYILRNKYNPDIAFQLGICFERDAKCYQQMTSFHVMMVDVQSDEA